MKIDEILAAWEIDCKIDKTELGTESLRIPQLHSKYLKYYMDAVRMHINLNNSYKTLYKAKHAWYQGILSKEELKNFGWEPQPLKILRTDIPFYLEADTELQSITTQIKLQEQKMSMLENIIKAINNRNYTIRNAVDWIKFQQGL